MKYIVSIAIILTFSLNASSQIRNIDTEVDSILNLMTLDEKIGQMAQAERGALENLSDISTYSLGSLLSGGGSAPEPNTAQSWANMYDNYQSYALQSRLGIPLIYGVDAVHGHNNVYGAVIFPHNIGLGCTWNTELVTTINQITAKEVAATGIDWTFSPCIAVPQDERWGRTYEGFGETPEIQKLMSSASVIGLQGDDLSEGETILACAKHFVGDGGTLDGIDQGNTQISEELLRSLHMSGYIDAIEANVGSVMASYNSWNGQKLHGHDYLLNDVLKDELGFEGFVISDWKGVDQVNEDYREAVKRSINAGIDMVMVPDRYIYFISILKNLVETNEVSLERIDDAVRRILKQKLLLNLFEEPYTDQSLISSVGSEEHRNIAKQAVRESLVLLNAKNNILPLSKNGQKILVVGRLANDLGALCGGWSIAWQGANGNITEGTNLLEGIENLSETSEVVYSQSGNYSDPVDVAVVVIGEDPYTEGAGDRVSLNIESEQVEMVRKLKEKGIPVVAVLVSGRPMIISEVMPYTDAMIAAWLPGTEGEGIAQVLFGDYQPTALLTHSWPRSMSQIPINYGDDNYNPMFEYKYGLQDFPTAVTSDKLSPYAAMASSLGNTITLSVTDKITDFNSVISDFTLKINNIEVADNIQSINLSDYDESIIIIELVEAILQSDEDISISYNGDGIISNGIILENFQDLYVFNAVSGFGGTMEIPGIVQAENYFDMHGIQTEPCTDAGGGSNVGYIEPGDWMKYNVSVSKSGKYEITSRISGYVPGSMSFTFDGGHYTSVTYSSTNGWQSWQNFSTEVDLDEGQYEMKVRANNDGFNINYFVFDFVDGIDSHQLGIADINIYPNPIVSDFNVNFSSTKNTNISIKLFDMSGIIKSSLYSGKVITGQNTFNFTLDSKLPSGMYFIEVKDESKRYFGRVVVK